MKRFATTLLATAALLIAAACSDSTAPKVSLPPGWEGLWAMRSVDGQIALPVTLPNDGGQIRYDLFNLDLYGDKYAHPHTLFSAITLFSKTGGDGGAMHCNGFIQAEFSGDTIRTSLVEQTGEGSLCSPEDFKGTLVRHNDTLTGNWYGHSVKFAHYIPID